MKFILTPDQFDKLQTVLSTASGAKLEMSGAKSGTLTTSDVTLLCVYDGTCTLYVTVEARHSFKAKIAPESLIESKVTAMFDQFIGQLS